uniref:Uncharacterized protein n=1 Tax=Sphenodon punctatus TaxID=8508 RepID=A0A8D0GDX2_SPHPU
MSDFPQKQTALDSVSLSRSLQVSIDTPGPPDSIEKRGLVRRPKNRRAVNEEAFEGGVEQNLLHIKGSQNYLMDFQATSTIRATTVTNVTNILFSDTELFTQPPQSERSHAEFSAFQLRRSTRKTPAHGSLLSSSVNKEPQQDMELDMVTEEGMACGSHGEELDPDHADQMPSVPEGKAAHLRTEQQEHQRRSSRMFQLLGAAEQQITSTGAIYQALHKRSSSAHN